jgi:hypothetical protein
VVFGVEIQSRVNLSTRPSISSSALPITSAPKISRDEMLSPSAKWPSRIAVTGISSVTSMTLVAPERRKIWKNTI